MEENKDIKDELRKFKITHNELLKYINNFTHTTRISEELSRPLTEKRKKVYLLAIKKIKEERIKMLTEDFDKED